METLKTRDTFQEAAIAAHDLEGEPVLSREGRKIGKVMDVHIHPTKLTVEGISVKTPMFHENDYIGREYIAGVSEKGVVLKIVPSTEYDGAKVIDANGKSVGTVKEVKRNNQTNNISSMVISRSDGGNDLIVKKSDVLEFGDKIKLKANTK